MAVHTGPNGETLYQKQPEIYGRSSALDALGMQREINRRMKAWADAGYPQPKRTFWQKFFDWLL